MLQEEKGQGRRLETVTYPFECSNYDRRVTVAKNKEELHRFLLDTKRRDGNQIDRIAVAGIHPEYFISDESWQLLALFSQFKRYGLQAILGDEAPAGVIQAFDIIQGVIDRLESQRMKAMKANAKKKK